MNTASKTLEQFVEASLKSRLKKLSSNLQKTEEHPENADHIHDLRVAIRRYTQGLRIFKHLLNRGDVRKIRRRVRSVMDLCGTIRNCDIAHEVLQASRASVPGPVERRLTKMRSHAERELRDLIEDSNILSRTQDWNDRLRAQAGSNQTINSTARRVLIPLTKKFLDAGVGAANPESTPLEMHRFRLQGKRIRYTLEIFGALAGPDWEKWIANVRDLQEHLGAINDCVTTRDLIADPNSPSHALRVAESALERLLRERIQTFREYWDKNLGAEERRSWIANVRKIGRTE